VTLREVLAAEGRLALQEALHLMTQVLDALACAHARGVVHRDLKPDNVMVTRTGVRRNALVLDFGLGGFTEGAENWALPRITGADPVPECDRGNIAKMSAAWLRWGRDHGYQW